MITVSNFQNVLEILGFKNENNVYTKHFDLVDCDLAVDFAAEKLIYPEANGFVVGDTTTSNFSHPENFVVFECVNNLFQKGYRPEHIELEPRWSLGHDEKSGKADICIKNADGSHYLCIIECKTAGAEWRKELSNMLDDDKANGGQLFSYWQQERATKWLCLYASDFDGESLSHTATYVNCTDDANIEELAKTDKATRLFKNAGNAKELFSVWSETYKKAFVEIDILFGADTVAYNIGTRPLRKKDLVDFSRDDKIVNRFEEILRHNNVSDKENAFNRLITLFIAKLYDEKTKTEDSEVDFQYKVGTDTYQKMQDRLQHLHQLGMKEFMKEDVFYIEEDFVAKTIKQYTGAKRAELEKTLNEAITNLKFYTNNDFTFKDVHNKTLFYQNGKILVEMVQLFQKFRIIDSKDLQLLGDLFEQLLNKGFKQNEGQFFTPVPITSFIWKSLPLAGVVAGERGIRYPKIIDYACGAGHFLTEGFAEINKAIARLGLTAQNGWERNCIYGIEKDYRLARVSKISLFMHGADEGNIIFGDGLENYDEAKITNGTFDILVANPPYSVSAFKNHLEVKNNHFKILDCISKDGSEIETLFVERIAQLLRPKGIAAVILPSSILSNGAASYIRAREELLQNFEIRSIVQFGSKTFGATGTNTVVLFLKKHDEPPVMANITKDIVSAIFADETLGWQDEEIFAAYTQKIGVPQSDYKAFLQALRSAADYAPYENHAYFGMYAKAFTESADYKTAKKQDERATIAQNDGTEVRVNRIKAFYAFVMCTEKEKIYYFALIYRQKTLVVTAPADNAEQEAFLGYGWSNRKGDEGIKIKSANPSHSCGLLYNTGDEENSIARHVQDSFLDFYHTSGAAENYMRVCDLADMLDFSRTSFDKAVRAGTQLGMRNEELGIKSQFPLVKLGEICEIVRGVTFDKKLQTTERTKNVVLTADNITLDGHFVIEKEIFVSESVAFDDEKKLRKNDCFMCFSSGSRTHVGKVALIDKDTDFYAGGFMGILRTKNENSPHFLYEMLNSENIRNSIRSSANGTNILNLSNSIAETKIPLPPPDVQKSIVAECEAVDAEYRDSEKTIGDCKTNISAIMTAAQGEQIALGEIGKICMCKRIMKHQTNAESGIPFYKIGTFGGKANAFIPKELYEQFKAEHPYPKKGQILISAAGTLGKAIAFDGEPAYFQDSNIVWIDNDESRVLNQYLLYSLQTVNWKDYATDGSVIPRIYNENLRRVQIPVPPLVEQQHIVAQVSALEAQIAAAKRTMSECTARKRAVLERWL